MRKLVVALFAACATWVAVCASAALADGPGAGAPTVVAVGDSAISGEAGRWAGNTNGSSSNVDALGPTDPDVPRPGCDDTVLGGASSSPPNISWV